MRAIKEEFRIWDFGCENKLLMVKLYKEILTIMANTRQMINGKLNKCLK